MGDTPLKNKHPRGVILIHKSSRLARSRRMSHLGVPGRMASAFLVAAGNRKAGGMRRLVLSVPRCARREPGKFWEKFSNSWLLAAKAVCLHEVVGHVVR